MASTALRSTHFNPRSPHGERHALVLSSRKPEAFQSTLPARGATCRLGSSANRAGISIHAPRTGSDLPPWKQRESRRNFNPRSPHGERPACSDTRSHLQTHFNPRSPHGERRNNVKKQIAEPENFNPRSPHGERPCRGYKARTRADNFNPRSPHGERRDRWQMYHNCKAFQSTLPARGATKGERRMQDYKLFQSTLPVRGATPWEEKQK